MTLSVVNTLSNVSSSTVWALVATAANIATFVRWLAKRYVNAKVEESFVASMATNHLPHIYKCLQLIAEKLNVELPEKPDIKFEHFNGGM